MSVVEYLKRKRAEDKFVTEVEKLDTGTLTKLDELAESTKPSLMVLKEIITYSSQIAKRDEISQVEILAGADEVDVSEASQRLKALRKNLFLSRFPERAKVESALKEEIENVRKEMNLKLSLPDDLEGDTLEISLKFRKAEDLEKQLEGLRRLAQSDSLKNIQDLLTGRT